ncbi:glycosyl hydrolase family 5 [Corallincola holothuriorum]|uniref:Endoglucanase n=1 Tax=Corallincola holothuriorum TaxID=2282215 RepID=A0A368NM85_9GAMM|nr:glycoside hydrolase family 9 protein [Corallincola holothuriorum]RCU50421.1 glycosyl hydrolase family 5 [Corallincola holothuriorum]
MKLSKLFLATLAFSQIPMAVAHNYGEALQKSIYFYEAQQSGAIPSWNRNEWRGDSAMQDGHDNNVDLTGGWYDAGDHVKFGFPMAATATMLAWGVVDYRDAYEQTGQLTHIENNLRFVADYFVKAHVAPNVLYGQVGKGSVDHSWWGAAEVMRMQRPSYKVDAQNPGSDLAGETAAALAAISIVFKQTDPTYAATLLTHAKQLYSFADKYRGKYSDSITDAKAFYNSWSGYQDELVWGALWLYRATGDSEFLVKAKDEYKHLGTESQTNTKSYKWGQAWDDKAYGSYVLMASLTDESEYQADAERWLDYWTVGYKGSKVRYTPGGMAFLDTWGAARYTANTSFAALVYSDYLKSRDLKKDKADIYYNFAKGQLDYILGDNPLNISYQIGYGNYYPTKPHHRTAHGTWNDSSSQPVENRHLLVGALVGGPGLDDSWTDDRGDYVKNEVATDYNAGFTSALARLWLDEGGTPIPASQFPVAEVRDTELFVEAKVNSEGPRYIELSTKVHNHTAWPARTTSNLKFRYWVDLTEVYDAGYTANDVSVSTAYSQGSGISGLHAWGDKADNLYYAEVSLEGVDVYPGGQSASKKEVQFRLSLPTNTNRSDWDNSNDPSWDNYGSGTKNAPKIALYDGDTLVWGEEPSASCGDSTGINCAPVAKGAQLVTAYETPVQAMLIGSDSDGSIAKYQVAMQPQQGVVSIDGDIAQYTPDDGFFGDDKFSFTVVDNDGAVSSAADVTVQVAAPIIPAVAITSPADGGEVKAGESIDVRINLKNAHGANLYVDGILIDSRVGNGSIKVQIPDQATQIEITVVSTDEQGEELAAQDSVRLTVVEEADPVDPVDPVDPIDPVQPGDISCQIGSVDQWHSGFVLNNISITNNGNEAIDGWKVKLLFNESVAFVNGWNGVMEMTSNGRVLHVSHMSYNSKIQPGQSTSFGLQGEHGGNFTAPDCQLDK